MTRDDAELQFVLGHEIGHVDLKHCVRGLNYAAHISKWTDATVGELSQVAYRLIALGYSADLEFAADEYAFRALIAVGRSRNEALAFPRHLLTYARENGFETGGRKPSSLPDAAIQQIENHFRSHPPAEERLKRLEKIKA
jgi:Zn-dependent protease with chaperone function